MKNKYAETILLEIRNELKANGDKTNQEKSKRFFKEPIECYGTPTALVGKLARSYWEQLKRHEKKDIYSVCEGLLSSNFNEEAFVVSYWGEKFAPILTEDDLPIFERWIDRYINNWAKCDGFCNHALGDYFMQFPHQLPILKEWAKSTNHWMRRAAVVSLIIPGRKGMYLQEAFALCDILLMDKEDLVQKGYGWLLKEESRKNQQAVLDYVIGHKAHMPRTALRYAIELMPDDLRKKAMEK